MTARVPYQVELRRDLQMEIFLGVVVTTLALGLAILQASRIVSLVWLGAASCFGAATLGVWFAKEWARWAFGILAGIIAVAGAGNVIMNFTATLPVHKVVGWIVQTMMWGCVAVGMLQPKTRQSFAAAREAITRARSSSA